MFIADTNNHLIRTIDLQRDNKVTTLEIKGLKAPEVVVVAAVANADDKPSFPNATEVKVAPVTLKAKDGKIQFAVKLKLPTGFKINPLAPMRYYPEPVAEKGPLDRAGLKKPIKVDPPSAEFAIALPAIETAGSDELKISLNYNYCQAGTDGECKFGSVIWTIPLKLSTDAESNSAPLEFEVP